MKLKDYYTAPTRTSGPGGAHIGFAMFGARGPMLDEHEGGGTGAPAPKPEGQGGSKPEPKPAGEGEKLFSQADLDRILDARLARERAGKKPEKAAAPGEQRNESPNGKADNSDATWVFDLQDALDAVSEETGAKASQGLKKRMRAAYAAERPSDPNAWVKSWFDDAGLKKPDTTNNQQQPKGGEGTVAQEQKKQADGPSISDKGGAGGVVLDFEAKLTERPLELTAADIDRLEQKHGAEKAAVLIRDNVDRVLSKRRLVADPRRKAQ